jgi:hypothetical protein
VSSAWPAALRPSARGGGMAGSDHATAALPRTRGATLLASGPCHNSFSKILKPAQTL